jgi:hypothetical protein
MRKFSWLIHGLSVLVFVQPFPGKLINHAGLMDLILDQAGLAG